MSDLTQRSASELAAMIRAGEVSSREVVRAHLDRIRAVNDHVNAITVVLEETALAAADAADASTVSGPLHGVPFTIKENIDCTGSATTQGVPALADALPAVDAPVVARMKAAGAIPLARTNMPEMGLRLSTDNPLRGRTLNPWHTELTAGGSSGGEGAALATGMTPFGLGNDIGGSLRNPAYCCGVTSLKPTRGRIPHATCIEPRDAGMAVQLMLVEGPMARSVADLKLGLNILAGRDIRDPVSVDAALEGSPPDVRRAALVREIDGMAIPASTLAALTRAGDIMRAAGWEVVETQPPELERVSEIWGNVFAIDFSELLPLIEPIITPQLHVMLSRLIDTYMPSVPNSVVHAERARLERTWSEFFNAHPVVIGPTWCHEPWPYAADLDPVSGIDLLLETTRFIMPGNVLGLPSVALPTGSVDGMPSGIQVYADQWREDLCLAAAATIEAEVGAPRPIDPIR